MTAEQPYLSNHEVEVRKNEDLVSSAMHDKTIVLRGDISYLICR